MGDKVKRIALLINTPTKSGEGSLQLSYQESHACHVSAHHMLLRDRETGQHRIAGVGIKEETPAFLSGGN